VSDPNSHSKESLRPVQIVPLLGLPDIAPGDDIAGLLGDAIRRQNISPARGDILVVAQKIISKSEGKIVRLDSVVPSNRAKQWAAEYQKDPRVIELVLHEALDIVKMERGVIVARTRHGFVCANAGVDISNAPKGTALLLPENPDASAQAIREKLAQAFGAHIAVIISDTFGRPWREGLVNVALGVAGISPLLDYRGQHDSQGNVLQATLIALADELAAAAGLAMGKLNHVPAALIRGVAISQGTGSARELIRSAERDLFR
jgi:coenzyme F420-0:L-glutamate ligase / coenzyme F420-1:gamma-L-glutamate ligase